MAHHHRLSPEALVTPVSLWDNSHGGRQEGKSASLHENQSTWGPRDWQWLWLQEGLISFRSEHEDQEMPGARSLGHRKLCPQDEQNQEGYVVETSGLRFP